MCTVRAGQDVRGRSDSNDTTDTEERAKKARTADEMAAAAAAVQTSMAMAVVPNYVTTMTAVPDSREVAEEALRAKQVAEFAAAMRREAAKGNGHGGWSMHEVEPLEIR